MDHIAKLVVERLDAYGDRSPGMLNMLGDVVDILSTKSADWSVTPEDAVHIPTLLQYCAKDLKDMARDKGFKAQFDASYGGSGKLGINNP